MQKLRADELAVIRLGAERIKVKKAELELAQKMMENTILTCALNHGMGIDCVIDLEAGTIRDPD